MVWKSSLLETPKILVLCAHLLHRGSGINLKPVRNFCSMVGICRDQERLISFSLLWLISDGWRLIIPRYTEKKELNLLNRSPLSRLVIMSMQLS